MTSLIAHLVRGATGAALIAWTLLFADTQPWLAVVSGVMAAIALRGCPACWVLGLYDKVTRPS
jgi:hypothetical protein